MHRPKNALPLSGKPICNAMAVVDKVVADIIRPGPSPEERECYEMAGEVRAIVPDLEELVTRIFNTEDGVE